VAVYMKVGVNPMWLPNKYVPNFHILLWRTIRHGGYMKVSIKRHIIETFIFRCSILSAMASFLLPIYILHQAIFTSFAQYTLSRYTKQLIYHHANHLFLQHFLNYFSNQPIKSI